MRFTFRYKTITSTVIGYRRTAGLIVEWALPFNFCDFDRLRQKFSLIIIIESAVVVLIRLSSSGMGSYSFHGPTLIQHITKKWLFLISNKWTENISKKNFFIMDSSTLLIFPFQFHSGRCIFAEVIEEEPPIRWLLLSVACVNWTIVTPFSFMEVHYSMGGKEH